MNTCSKYVIIAAITVSITSTHINTANTLETPEKAPITETTQFKVTPKKLGFLKMQAVSIGIAAQPTLLVTAWEGKEEAVKTLQEIAQPGIKPANFVKTCRDRLVTPLDAFLAPFRGYGAIVIPLIKESLGENSMLERLFNTPQSTSTKTFFDGEVQTIENLTLMSSEFNV
ncbi:MAG: hypothetical protein ABH827_04200, partial [bacterium]